MRRSSSLLGSTVPSATSYVFTPGDHVEGGTRRVQHPLPAPPQPDRLAPDRVLSVEGGRVRVRNREALDGTPIVDVKPILSGEIGEVNAPA